MPEGDTIFRTASVLRHALLGGVVRSAVARPWPGLSRVPDLSVLVGWSVSAVEARGKHLLIGFSSADASADASADGAGGSGGSGGSAGSGERWLRTHLRMKGSWHRYRPGERWRYSATRASVVLETDAAVAVAFDTPEVELLSPAELGRHARLRALGPDLLGASPDLSEAVRRLLDQPMRPLGKALLDQRSVAGIGNVIKSEAMFLERLDPWAPVSAFEEEELLAVLRRAAALLAANVSGGRRVTTGRRSPGESLWVYGRSGRPCRRCATLIQSRRQGEQARTTYWCPRCQAARA